jgi:hypothetical protein
MKFLRVAEYRARNESFSKQFTTTVILLLRHLLLHAKQTFVSPYKSSRSLVKMNALM